MAHVLAAQNRVLRCGIKAMIECQALQIQHEMFNLHNRWCLAWAALWSECEVRVDLVASFLSEVVIP